MNCPDTYLLHSIYYILSLLSKFSMLHHKMADICRSFSSQRSSFCRSFLSILCFGLFAQQPNTILSHS
ncbi:unnamed protein product [Meloidogyne enterolobii]|uniref:Uncharacterized protein n=1 Tax=Meloidogyne enterolobii TaxID=390850 RepID=A0ACB0XLA4_MELEN